MPEIPEEDYIEQRGQARRNLVYFPQIYLAGNKDEEFGRVVDLTVEGFLVIRYSPLAIEEEHDLQLYWSGEMDKEICIDCRARVCWCRKDVNPDLWAVGFNITEISQKDEQAVQRLIRKWSFPVWE